MDVDIPRVVELFAALEAEAVDYVLVGGIAVNLHGLVRATEDVDLFVRPSEENVARLRAALRRVWNDPAIDDIRVKDVEDYAVVRYGPPEPDDFLVDLISRIGTAVRWEDLEAQDIIFEGVRVRVATPATLVRMKKGTMRPVDQGDVVNLREKFGLQS